MNLIKKALVLLYIPIIIASLAINSSAATATCWFIKHSGHTRPELPDEVKYIFDYGGYYADMRLCEDSEEKKLYLTFDVGYANENVEKIVDTLSEKSVSAAFFVLDNIIIKNTDLIMKMVNDGHLICNHTKRHRDLTKCTSEEINSDLSALEEIYTEKTGLDMSKYFRFPEGRYSEAAIKCINELGYKTIFWSFAYADWDNNRQPSEKFAINKILSNTHNGAVILLHPNSKTNASILPRLIDEWRAMGYEFGTLDELTAK